MVDYDVHEDKARKVIYNYQTSIRYVKDVIAELYVQGKDTEALAVTTNVLVPMEAELGPIITAFSS